MQPNFSASVSLQCKFKICMVQILKMNLLVLLPSLTHSAGDAKKKIQNWGGKIRLQDEYLKSFHLWSFCLYFLQTKLCVSEFIWVWQFKCLIMGVRNYEWWDKVVLTKIRCLQWSQQADLSCGWCQSEQTIMMFPFFTSRMCLQYHWRWIFHRGCENKNRYPKIQN